MKFLALIYENEKRFEQGFDEAEFAEYGCQLNRSMQHYLIS